MTPASPEPRIEKRRGVGVVFHMRRFDDPEERGIARRCELTGWNDFPDGGYEHWVEDGVQKIRIHPSAVTNGDAGIQRNFRTNPGDRYRLTAKVRLLNKTGNAKFRLNLAARRSDHTQIEEFNDSTEKAQPHVQELTLEGVMPPGTWYLTARVKLHTSEPGQSCEGAIHSIKLERLI